MILELLRDTFDTIRAHAFRFSLTSVGMVWGLMMLTYLSASMDGYDEHFSRQLAEIGQRIVILFPGVVAKPAIGNRGARTLELRIRDASRLAHYIAIERAAPNLRVGARMFRAGSRTKLVYTYGVTPDTAPIRNFQISIGRFLSANDASHNARVVVLGSKAANRLFGTAAPLNRTVHIDGIAFRVVGISQAKGEQVLYVGPPDDEVALIPITTAQALFTHSKAISEIFFAPRTRPEGSETLQLARGLLGLHLRYNPTDETAIRAFNIEDVVVTIEGLMLGLRLFFSFATLTTLVAGAVGVMNIMLVMVNERTREIGLRKAVGASNRAIFVQFISETLIVTLISGFMGIVLGWMCVQIAAAAIGSASSMQAAPVLHAQAVALATGTLVVAGLVAGVLPAARAIRIDPAVALRAT